MNDNLAAILEALRLVRAEVADYQRYGRRDAAPRLRRIDEVVYVPVVQRAADQLAPVVDAPSLVPQLPYGATVQ